MAKGPRRNHTAAFKAKVALEAVKEEKTIIEIAEIYDVHPNQVTQWKKQLLERASDAFEKEQAPEDGPSARELNAKIGQLVMENDFLAGALGKLHGTSAKK
jgi:transposase